MATSAGTSHNVSDINNNPGYLKELKIIKNIENNKNFCLFSEKMIDLEMKEIRMFTLLTGKNGSGKSKILKSIRYKLNRYKDGRNLSAVKINWDSKSYSESIPIDLQAILIHFDSNLIDLRGQSQTERGKDHPEVNFYELINKKDATDTFTSATNLFTYKNLSDIRYILNNLSKEATDELNQQLLKSSYFNFKYNNDYKYLEIEPNNTNQTKGWKENIKLTDYKINEFIKNLNSKNNKGLCGFDTKDRIITTIEECNKNPEFSQKYKYTTDFVFENKITKELVPLLHLTSGELVLMLFFLLRYVDVGNKQILLMLDEPDAFLNPSCVHYFLKCIFDLVREKKIQVIMTTHNSTTVSLVAREKLKNAFFMVYEDENKIKTKSFDSDNMAEIFNELHSDLISVHIPFKVVFVEGSDSTDCTTYVLYYEECLKKFNEISKNVHVLFKPIGKQKGSKRVGKNDVIKAVEAATYKKDTQRSDIILSNFIYGIVDKDYDDNSQYQNLNNLRILKRCNKENYLFDPINLFFVLVNQFENNQNSVEEQLKNFLSKNDLIENQEETVLKEFIDSILQEPTQNFKASLLGYISNIVLEKENEKGKNEAKLEKLAKFLKSIIHFNGTKNHKTLDNVLKDDDSVQFFQKVIFEFYKIYEEDLKACISEVLLKDINNIQKIKVNEAVQNYKYDYNYDSNEIIVKKSIDESEVFLSEIESLELLLSCNYTVSNSINPKTIKYPRGLIDIDAKKFAKEYLFPRKVNGNIKNIRKELNRNKLNNWTGFNLGDFKNNFFIQLEFFELNNYEEIFRKNIKNNLIFIPDELKDIFEFIANDNGN